MENRLINKDPYQWFFLPGILFGILGVGLWIAFALGKLTFYPVVMHSEIMTNGFVMIVAVGFLMTAIPKFTQTSSASFFEKFFIALSIISLFLVSLLQQRNFFYINALVIDLLMLRFIFLRVQHCKVNPPTFFILVAFGLVTAFLGNLLLLLQVTGPLLNLARLFINYGLSMGLVLGVGSQLVPTLLGTKKETLIPLQIGLQQNIQLKKQRNIFISFAIILLISFGLEALGFFMIGRLVQAILVSGIISVKWRVYLFPKNKTIFSWCLWTSAWMLNLGLWPSIFYPAYAVHTAHLFFIGSFSIMIFTIATRVTLAHGRHDMMLEKKAWGLWALLIFMILALLSRVGAPFTHNNFTHLAYAAIFWILGALCWCLQFVKKLYTKSL